MKRKLSLFIIGIMLSAFIPASALAAKLRQRMRRPLQHWKPQTIHPAYT